MSPSSPADRKSFWWALAGVGLAVFLVFSPSLRNGFVNWDDDVFLLLNEDIRAWDGDHLRAVFSHTINRTYVPLTELSFAWEYHFFGHRPFIYHLDNVLLHTAATMTVLLLARRCGLALLGAVVSALLFGLHPLKVESVAWATGRKDVLYGFFFLLSLLDYLGYLQQGGWSRYLRALLWGGLSVLAKPVAVCLPGILLLFDVWQGRGWTRRVMWDKLPFILLMVPVAMITLILHPRVPGPGAVPVPAHEQFLLGAWSYFYYLRMFFWPATLVLFHDLPRPVQWGNPTYLLPAAGIVLLIFGVACYRKRRGMAWAVAFYTLAIASVIVFPRLDDPVFVADRYMYIPGLGLCLWLGAETQTLWGRLHGKRQRTAFLVGMAALLALMAGRSIQANRPWKNGVELWSHQWRQNPDVVPGLVIGKWAEASAEDESLRQTVAKIRIQSQGYLQDKEESVAVSVSSQERAAVDRVIGLFEKALAINPTQVSVYYQLGSFYRDLGQNDQALLTYMQALRHEPDQQKGRFLLAQLLRQMGRDEDAWAAYRDALTPDPFNPRIYFNILQDCQKAIEQDPANAAWKDFYEEISAQYLRNFQKEAGNVDLQ